MAKRKRKDVPLPTIWHVPDELWELIVPILDAYDPRAVVLLNRKGASCCKQMGATWAEE